MPMPRRKPQDMGETPMPRRKRSDMGEMPMPPRTADNRRGTATPALQQIRSHRRWCPHSFCLLFLSQERQWSHKEMNQILPDRSREATALILIDAQREHVRPFVSGELGRASSCPARHAGRAISRCARADRVCPAIVVGPVTLTSARRRGGICTLHFSQRADRSGARQDDR